MFCDICFLFFWNYILHICNTSKGVVQIFAMIISRDLSDWIIAKPPNFFAAPDLFILVLQPLLSFGYCN